jgi:uncharacterized protein YbjT (DUF2867 family)
MKILVIGGTGKVGAEVVKELQKRKADICLFVRKDGTPTPQGVEVAIGDLLDPVSVEMAMHGSDKLYLLNAVSPDELTQGLIAYDLAKKPRLKHIVYHSVFRVEHFKDVPHFASKLAMESVIREFEVPFTIIRPNYFIQQTTSFRMMPH